MLHAKKETRVLSEKKKASAQSRGPTLGEKDEEAAKLEAADFQKSPVCHHSGLTPGPTFLPAKGTPEGNEQRPGAQGLRLRCGGSVVSKLGPHTTLFSHKTPASKGSGQALTRSSSTALRLRGGGRWKDPTPVLGSSPN